MSTDNAVTAPIGVVVAMESELRHLLDRVTPLREVRDGPWLDRVVMAGDVPLVALCSGIGMVNAAAGTEHIIASHAPRAVLNFGCAGAHRRDILPGDVIIGDGTVYHGAMHILASGDEFFPGKEYAVTGEVVASTELATDPRLLDLTIEAAQGWTPEPWPRGLNLPPEIEQRPPRTHVGRVASADIWTQFHERIDRLHARHGSLCEDMEAAAIAQVCGRHDVPFMTVKDISNNEFHALTDLEGDIEVLPAAEIGRRAAALLLRTIERIGTPDSQP
jgi:adenosylhomocysteine nucleosidase